MYGRSNLQALELGVEEKEDDAEVSSHSVIMKIAVLISELGKGKFEGKYQVQIWLS